MRRQVFSTTEDQNVAGSTVGDGRGRRARRMAGNRRGRRVRRMAGNRRGRRARRVAGNRRGRQSSIPCSAAEHMEPLPRMERPILHRTGTAHGQWKVVCA
jgi:hypothetical protein